MNTEETVTVYELARFETRAAVASYSRLRVIRRSDGYEVVQSEDLDAVKPLTLYPSVIAALASEPELVTIAAADTTSIWTSELEDWEVGDLLMIRDLGDLESVPKLDDSDLPSGNGWPLDLLCTINGVEWWYYRVQDNGYEDPGFFVPANLDDRTDVDRVADCFWADEDRWGNWGDRLRRLGTLYHYWNTAALEDPDGPDDLFRFTGAPKDQAIWFFSRENEFRTVMYTADLIEMASPYLNDEDFEGLINSTDVDYGQASEMIVNGSNWVKREDGSWTCSPSFSGSNGPTGP